MKISVIVAVYNAAKTLQRCIDSINAQSYLDRELIIIDGGSTDGTVDILRTNNDLIAHWESAPDRGIYHAWNKALSHITGYWVIFLGADDAFVDKESLTKISTHLTGKIIYGNCVLTEHGARVGVVHKLDEAEILSGRMIPNTATFYHRSVFGRFDESYHIAGDYDFLLRTRIKPIHVDIDITEMSLGGVSSDIKTRFMLLNESARALRTSGHNPLTSFLIWGRIRALLALSINKISPNACSVITKLWRFIGRRQIYSR